MSIKKKKRDKEKYAWEKKKNSELPISLKCIRNLKSFKI
jgi:hypothetical protein